MRVHLLFLVVFLSGLVVSSGCDSGLPDDLPKLYPAELILTQDGKPLEEALVFLKSHQPTMQYTCGGASDRNGVARLRTHGRYPGVPEGAYTVTVIKQLGERTGPWDQVPSGGFDEREKWIKENRHLLKETLYNLVEPKYGNDATSDLEIVVTPKGLKTAFDFPAYRAEVGE